ncbi:guanylate kinase [Risungbinella massiliensis]|uniref:guanylate kinase n=1 Tax=Risungbinella massiliensis TaxID=1329796 RepID=UPI0005CC11C5|nr:guanylate kinase [Risungbinella massiliensis]
MKASYEQSGLLIVVSGPSGVGKGTVCNYLRGVMPDLAYSISATTRTPRVGEEHGVNYFFQTKDEFQEMIQKDELIEWAEYVGNYYGTPRRYVEETLAAGKDVLLEIEVQGAMQVKKHFPQGLFIFLAPPSLEDLRERIVGRGTETQESLTNRLAAASEELAQLSEYDYVVVNDQVEKASERIRAILTAEHCKTHRFWMSEE